MRFFSWASSCAFPLPMYQLGWGTWRFCQDSPTTAAPAVSARAVSSASESWTVQGPPCPASTAMR